MPTCVVNSREHRFDVYVGRGSPFGNPYSSKPSKLAVLRVASSAQAVDLYRLWLTTDLEIPGWPKPTMAMIKGLYNKTLGCWCDAAPCHGYVLVELAEANQ